MRTGPLGAAMALAALWAAPPATAQVGQVSVAVQLLYNVETVFAADFAPYNVGQQPDFLGITLLNGGQARSVILEVVIRQQRPRSAELFRGYTDPFVLQPGAPRRITNRDLSNERSDVVIEEYDITSEAEEITDQVLETGRFPSGSYVFQISVLQPVGRIPLGRGEITIELVNPTRIELLTPGRPFGDSPEVISTPSPRFQWTSDAEIGVQGGTYRLRVVPADGAASPEEAMQAFPTWDETTSASTALYPGSVSAIPLAAGKTYAWQVTREIRTSGGNQFLESPIYWFKMAGGETASDEGGQNAGADLGASVQLDLLSRALGLGNQLLGFKATGMLVDGKPASVENLEALLHAILGGEVSVHSITVR